VAKAALDGRTRQVEPPCVDVSTPPKPRLLDLFSGIGGFSLGLERAGFETVALCEIKPFCRGVLRKHWPHVPCYEDVRGVTAERLAADGISVDVICGGFPCQDISEANTTGAGLDGERSGLWFEYARLVGELRPRFVIVENTSALLGRGLDRVLGSLAEIGYDAEWHGIPIGALGAPHERDRVWIIAYPASSQRRPILEHGHLERAHRVLAEGSEDAGGVAQLPEASWRRPWTEVADSFRGLDDGISTGFHGYNGLANAVAPAIPEMIGRAILSAGGSAATIHGDGVHNVRPENGLAA
jgi:DNA (cytosine-5)-methyltransferase 1